MPSEPHSEMSARAGSTSTRKTSRFMKSPSWRSSWKWSNLSCRLETFLWNFYKHALFSTSKFEAIMFFKVINNLLTKVSCLFSWMIFFTHRIPCGTWFRIPWSTSHRWCLMQAIQLWSCLKILHGELTSSAAPTSESHTLKNQLPMSYQNYRVVCSLYNFTETAMGSRG